MASPAASEILELWFSDHARARWFAKDPAFDDAIRTRFGETIEQAARGECDAWRATADGALALTILFDQFPRNIHRGSPSAFAYDLHARDVADGAIRVGHDQAVALDRRQFFYLPFQHAEALDAQERSLALFSTWASEHPAADRAGADEEMVYVRRHLEIIQRFGRFPHRNAVLGRASTAAEIAFLEEPSSSF